MARSASAHIYIIFEPVQAKGKIITCAKELSWGHYVSGETVSSRYQSF